MNTMNSSELVSPLNLLRVGILVAGLLEKHGDLAAMVAAEVRQGVDGAVLDGPGFYLEGA